MGPVSPDIRPEDRATEVLRPIAGQGEYFSSNLCHLIRHEEQAVLAGGAHELFVGAYRGGPGAYGLYFAAPELCIQIPIGVNGTTVVDIPRLEACELEPIGSADEVARRPSPPEDADGRLWIELDSSLGGDDYDFCRLDAYLLPAGTTLNEIGRGETWPIATVNFHMASSRHIDGRELRWAANPGRVPVLAMPPSGTGEVMVFPMFGPDGNWDAFAPDPARVPSGRYDLRVYQWCAVEEESGQEDTWCGSATVDVAGDTIVPLPELGACP
jgi:hypothetical protein